MPRAPEPRWLLLIHQIPPSPAYLRVKVGRRLEAVGAVAVKNSVYALPRGEQALEDLQWIRREIVAGRGEATLCEARFVEGRSDADVEALFDAARRSGYAAVAAEARSLDRALGRAKQAGPARAERGAQELRRLRKQLADVVRVDFFGAPGRDVAEGLLAGIEARLRPVRPAERRPARRVRGATWVTRRGVHVDRIASAWLVRRFIDPRARFRFVQGPDHAPRRGEVRFDMFQAEYTHDGDLCTFEVLLRDFGLHDDKALRALGEIVHDMDLKDARFARPEGAGLEPLLAGMALRHADDHARINEGAVVFDSLYECFRRSR